MDLVGSGLRKGGSKAKRMEALIQESTKRAYFLIYPELWVVRFWDKFYDNFKV